MHSFRRTFPAPFSSLTARSDFAANERFAPKVEDKPPFDKDLIMRLYQGLPAANQRAVDTNRRARKNPTE